MWKSDPSEKIEWKRCSHISTTVRLHRSEKKVVGNYTDVLCAASNKYWNQSPKKQQLYDHLPPISQTIQAKRAKHTGHCW